MDEIDHDFQVQHFEAMVAADDRDGASEPLLEKLQFALMRRQFDVGVLHASLRSKCGGDRTLKCGHAEFPEREPYLYTSQFNIQGRLDPLTDNSHLSTASSLSPSREAVDETKIIKGVSR